MEKEKFLFLFQEAIKKWPDYIDIEKIEGQLNGHYTVLGLGRQFDAIDNLYIGEKDEVIWRELQWALCTVIHAAAKNILKLKTSTVRPAAVQHVFEQRLRTAVAAKDPAWNIDDFTLVQSYFSEKND